MSAPTVPSLSAPASDDAAARERTILVETGLALAEPISEERVLHAAAQQIRRALACDAVVIAVTEQDVPRTVHHIGFEGEGAQLEDALAVSWSVAKRGRGGIGGMSRHDTPQGALSVVPFRSRHGAGSIAVLGGDADGARSGDELERTLATIALQMASALERSREVARTTRKARLEAAADVAAGIAHELRNPLFGISSAAQLLRFRVREDPVIEKNLGRILREVERLNGMVSSLLEYARPAPLRLAPRDPDELWQDVLVSHRGLLESKALAVRHQPAHPRVSCDVDGEQLAQAFVNVLANAVDAAPEGSDLALVSEATPNGSWRCRLQNGGGALPPDVLAHAFDLFFSTKPGAAGIGLAQCERIVEEHGGSIRLESGETEGATLTIVLPGRGVREGAARV